MIEKGAFDGLDACMMTHPSPADVVYSTILSVGGYKVEYFGKASHASASPWEGNNRIHVKVHKCIFFFAKPFHLLLNMNK